MEVMYQIERHFLETEKKAVDSVFTVQGFSFGGSGQNTGIDRMGGRKWLQGRCRFCADNRAARNRTNVTPSRRQGNPGARRCRRRCLCLAHRGAKVRAFRFTDPVADIRKQFLIGLMVFVAYGSSCASLLLGEVLIIIGSLWLAPLWSLLVIPCCVVLDWVLWAAFVQPRRVAKRRRIGKLPEKVISDQRLPLRVVRDERLEVPL